MRKLLFFALFMVLPQISGQQSSSTIFAETRPGTDFADKVNRCINDLPFDGGTCDATGLRGSQSMSTTLTISRSNVRLLLPPIGTASITSTANPEILITGSNVEIVGYGNATTSSPSRGTAFVALSPGIMLQFGDGTILSRALNLAGISFYANNQATLGIKLKSGVGYSKFDRIEINSVNGPCFDVSEGNISRITVNDLRCAGAVGQGWNGGTPNSYNGAIKLSNPLIQGVTGSPGVGFDVGYGNYTLDSADAELNVIGFRARGNSPFSCTGCLTAGNTSLGTDLEQDANGSATITGLTASADQLPIQIGSNPGATTVLINPNTVNTVGPNSLTVLAGATGPNVLLNYHFDKPINRAGNLQQIFSNSMDLGGIGYTLNGVPGSLTYAGSMVFCVNCSKGTDPCTTGGPGTMMFRTGTPSWRCP